MTSVTHTELIEAAAKAIWELADDDVGWEESKADPKMRPQIEWTLEEARIAIAAYEAAMWRPIEEAPKDGTPILGFLPRYGFSPETGIEVIWFEPSIKCWLRRGEAVVDLPTHFRPLPQPPEVKP